jgi:hypothetical protein
MTQFDGRWEIEASSPMGKLDFTLDLATDGASASGKLTVADQPSAPFEGTMDGSALTFEIDIDKPLSVKIAFTLAFDGDSVSGKVRPGRFPGAKARGSRVPAA